VFKGGIRLIPELNKFSGVVECFSRNSWMNEALTVQWVDQHGDALVLVKGSSSGMHLGNLYTKKK